jgi:signal transduction histidine kinase
VRRIGAAELLRGQGAPTLAGRIVFVGLDAAGLGDRVVTPATAGPLPDPGVLVQAAATEAILTGDLLRPAAPLLAGIAACLLVLAVGAVSRLGGVRRPLGEAALLAAPTAFALTGLHLAGAVVPTVMLTTIALGAILAVELRAGFVAWRHAGTTAALLGAAAGEAPPSDGRTLEGRLELVEELATEAARRRVAGDESARVLAHELKTPLTSVRGLGQMLRDLDLSADERRRAAGLLVTEADRLQAMIEHLTELERLPRRSFGESATDVDLSSLVRRRAEVLGDGHARVVRVDVVPGLHVRGDARLLERVLDNLLGNAFKFSPPEAPVEVRAFPRGDHAVAEVRDHGCGIPPEEQGAIFSRFVRGSAAQGREGMGLGLALVREVVTWHRGRVEVESAPGEGSIFTVALPLRQEESERGEDPRRR